MNTAANIYHNCLCVNTFPIKVIHIAPKPLFKKDAKLSVICTFQPVFVN